MLRDVGPRKANDKRKNWKSPFEVCYQDGVLCQTKLVFGVHRDTCAPFTFLEETKGQTDFSAPGEFYGYLVEPAHPYTHMASTTARVLGCWPWRDYIVGDLLHPLYK